MSQRITAFLLLVGPVACGAGCGGGKYSSPEATFETAKAAGKAQDWKAMWECYTPESVETMAGMMVLAGGFAGDKTAAVLEKHGVEKPGPGVMVEAMRTGKAPNEVGKDLAKGISDKTQFIADMQNAMQQDQGADVAKMHEDARMEDLTINGDSATAKMIFSQGSAPLKFKRIDGAWKLEVVMPTRENMPTMDKPPGD